MYSAYIAKMFPIGTFALRYSLHGILDKDKKYFIVTFFSEKGENLKNIFFFLSGEIRACIHKYILCT